MVAEIEKEWMAVNPHTDEIVAGGDTKQEVRERLHHLELDPDDYDIVATPKNFRGGGPF